MKTYHWKRLRWLQNNRKCILRNKNESKISIKAEGDFVKRKLILTEKMPEIKKVVAVFGKV